ncbi:hypothetical protein RIF29_20331 [Crotalaria pallida]|uniref:Uncharacterized protein n=1 Tax=Crotalaria pallida TaxID=3830 RepID=A0AAN9I4X9_CROPI
MEEPARHSSSCYKIQQHEEKNNNTDGEDDEDDSLSDCYLEEKWRELHHVGFDDLEDVNALAIPNVNFQMQGSPRDDVEEEDETINIDSLGNPENGENVNTELMLHVENSRYGSMLDVSGGLKDHVKEVGQGSLGWAQELENSGCQLNIMDAAYVIDTNTDKVIINREKTNDLVFDMEEVSRLDMMGVVNIVNSTPIQNHTHFETNMVGNNITHNESMADARLGEEDNHCKRKKKQKKRTYLVVKRRRNNKKGAQKHGITKRPRIEDRDEEDTIIEEDTSPGNMKGTRKTRKLEIVPNFQNLKEEAEALWRMGKELRVLSVVGDEAIVRRLSKMKMIDLGIPIMSNDGKRTVIAKDSGALTILAGLINHSKAIWEAYVHYGANHASQLSASGRRQKIKEFENFIRHMGLLDLPMVGRKFTWYLKNGTAMSRILRFQIFDMWFKFWPGSTQKGLKRSFSDHCPILLLDKIVGFSNGKVLEDFKYERITAIPEI